jgi:hypothetical protein
MSKETPPAVLHHPNDLTHQWLECALNRHIVRCEQESQSATCSSHIILRVWIDSEASPLRLRVKLASAELFGTAEVDYYVKDFVGLEDAPILTCHHAAADATGYHLLLDDVSQTHRDQMDLPPTHESGLAMARAIAMLHAHRWNQSPPALVEIQRSLAEAQRGKAIMIDAMREGFVSGDRELVIRCVESMEATLTRRCDDAVGFAWVHGDLNPGNVLIPIDGNGKVYLIDHQPFVGSSLTRWLAVSDLAYAIITWWPVDARRRWARDVVVAWHAALLSRGVKDYSLAQCMDEWLLCGIQQLCVPAARCAEEGAVTKMRWLWEMQLRRVLAFLNDHQRELSSIPQ